MLGADVNHSRCGEAGANYRPSPHRRIHPSAKAPLRIGTREGEECNKRSPRGHSLAPKVATELRSRTLRRCDSIRDRRNRHTIMRKFLPSWCRAARTGSTKTLKPTTEEERKEQCSAAADDHHRGRPSMQHSHRLLMRFAISSTCCICSKPGRCPSRTLVHHWPGTGPRFWRLILARLCEGWRVTRDNAGNGAAHRGRERLSDHIHFTRPI